MKDPIEKPPYDFRQDLIALVNELKEGSGMMYGEPRIVKKKQIYTQTLREILKAEKHSLYLLERRSKLRIDKAFYKHNYVDKGVLDIEIFSINLFALLLNPTLFDSLVMIDKKQNVLKMVAGIPLPPARSNFLLKVSYIQDPERPDKRIEVGKQMRIYRMKKNEHLVFKALLQKVREAIHKQLDLI